MKFGRSILKFHRPQRRLQLIALGIAVLVGLILTVSYVVYRANLRPVSNDTAKRPFTIASGQNAPMIAKSLQSVGLIRDATAFTTYVNVHALRTRLKAGIYELSPSYSADRIARVIAGGQTLTRQVVVPEGYTLTDIEAAAAKVGIAKADFQTALAAAHPQSFLTGKPASVSLEGYLFPDSYSVNSTTTASQLVNSMLDNFGSKVGQEYVQAFAAEGLTLHQGLTLASIIEREVNIAADRPIVAQIFLKRYKTGMPLGSDVTADYASKLLGLSSTDINANSPYNTRRFAGLPPGPICSPGLSALDAAAKPAATDYLYFLSGNDGKTHFAKTYAEHQANIVKYLQ